jgi:hypothetical protein
MRPGRRIRSTSAVIITVLAAACGGGQSAPPRTVAPANSEVATSLVIDQFLRAANSNDLDTMARLFGTREGSVLLRDPKENVDRQMFALASLLRHESYAIKGYEVVPGRREEATRAIVTMTISGREFDVPWTLVYATTNSWMVEEIGLNAITRR